MASVPVGAVKPRNWWLFFSTLLLLFQFFLRSHNILAYPRDPNENDLFFLETVAPSDLPFHRLMVALFSLLAGVALYNLGKRIFSRRVGIMVQWLYAVMPFTIFYDRMVSMSSITLTGLLLFWIFLIFLKSPMLQLGTIIGIICLFVSSAAMLDETKIITENFFDNLRLMIENTAIFYWSPALLITAIAWLVLLWQRPQLGILLGTMSSLIWLLLLVGEPYPRTRTLEISIPFLLLILVAGLYESASLIREPGRRSSVERLIMVSFLVYGLSWGLPFWEKLVSHPEDLNLPAEIR